MAATFHQGFSDHPAGFDVEIGHYLGLRWFHVSQIQHGIESVRQSRTGPAVATCRCGDTSRGSMDSPHAWLARHGKARYDIRLSGVRDNWQRGENVARCLSAGYPSFGDAQFASHSVPVESCGCGFWAYWALGDKLVGSPAIAGIIKGYGEVIEGERGFRCSHAKIIALFPLVYSTELALALEDAYGADVYHSFQAMLEMNPAPAGQPPLTDAWFSRKKLPCETTAPTYTYVPKPTRINDAFRQGLVPCPKCGTVACVPGQVQCVACDIAEMTAKA
jgi:hypothetical protein